MITDHIQVRHKRGCRIVTVDPSTKTIEGKIQRGEVVPIYAYAYTPSFRWPKVGENWIIEERNGSWFLDSIWEEQEPTEQNEEKSVGAVFDDSVHTPLRSVELIVPEAGDHILSASSGRILVNESGKLRTLSSGSGAKEFKLSGPFAPMKERKTGHLELSETQDALILFQVSMPGGEAGLFVVFKDEGEQDVAFCEEMFAESASGTITRSLTIPLEHGRYINIQILKGSAFVHSTHWFLN